jgi:cytochrome c oxidase subunit IV
MEATVSGADMRRTLIAFSVGAAAFVAIIGGMIGEVSGAIGIVPGGMAGFLVGAFIGAGGVLLAWRPQPQDAATPIRHVDHPNYMLIWGVLFVLMMTKVVVAFLAFSKVAIIAILVLIAIWKAVLVALFYMHLKFEPRRMWLLAASPIPLAGILLFALLSTY